MDLYENGEAFDVRFETWDNFKAIVLDPASHIDGWNRLATMDCILGGVDYAVDHMYVRVRSTARPRTHMAR